jgi:hypothetical protein
VYSITTGDDNPCVTRSLGSRLQSRADLWIYIETQAHAREVTFGLVDGGEMVSFVGCVRAVAFAGIWFSGCGFSVGGCVGGVWGVDGPADGVFEAEG